MRLKKVSDERVVAGFFLSPLIAILIGSIYFLISHIVQHSLLANKLSLDMPFFFTFFYIRVMIPIAYMGALFVGIPGAFILMKMQFTQLRSYIPFGCLTGLITSTIGYNGMKAWNTHYDIATDFLLFPFGFFQPILCGSVGMSVFWLIVVRPRIPTPKKESPSESPKSSEIL